MASPAITLSPGGGFLLEPTGSATIFTPEMLTEEHLMMKKTADDFMRGEVLPRVNEIEAKKPGLMRELMEKAGALGLLGHDVPEAYGGGLDGDKSSASLIAESVAMQGSFAVSFGAHVGIGTMPIALFGTKAQQRKVPAGARVGREDRGLRAHGAGLGHGRAPREEEGGAVR